ncbi:hypothetical protein D9M72_507160 [compost metagenome]
MAREQPRHLFHAAVLGGAAIERHRHDAHAGCGVQCLAAAVDAAHRGRVRRAVDDRHFAFAAERAHQVFARELAGRAAVGHHGRVRALHERIDRHDLDAGRARLRDAGVQGGRIDRRHDHQLHALADHFLELLVLPLRIEPARHDRDVRRVATVCGQRAFHCARDVGKEGVAQVAHEHADARALAMVGMCRERAAHGAHGEEEGQQPGAPGTFHGHGCEGLVARGGR